MRITYKSSTGAPTVSNPSYLDAKDNDLREWTNGETRDIPDDRMVRFRKGVHPGGEEIRARAVDVVLSQGPDWVDAATGVNPDFACADTGSETRDLYFFDGAGKKIDYANDDGSLLSVEAFLTRHPEYIDLHESRGLDPAIVARAREAVAAKSGDTPPGRKETPPTRVEPNPAPPAAPAEHEVKE